MGIGFANIVVDFSVHNLIGTKQLKRNSRYDINCIDTFVQLVYMFYIGLLSSPRLCAEQLPASPLHTDHRESFAGGHIHRASIFQIES